MPKPEKLDKQQCPMCHKDTLALYQEEVEVPYFGKTFVFSMDCSGCGYHKADVEAAEKKDKATYTLEVDSEKDMHIRIIKSSQATIKIPHIATIEPGEASNGYITNVEGILNRVKVQTEHLRDNAEETAERKKAKNIIKKLQNVMWGREKLKITIDDPSGNSAIISEKAVKK